MIDLERDLQPVLDDAIAPKPFAAVRARAAKLRRRRMARRVVVAISIGGLVVGAIAVIRPRPQRAVRVVADQPSRALKIGEPTRVDAFGNTLISAFGSIWLSAPQRVVRLDSVTGRVLANISVGGTSDVANLAAGGGAIWVDNTGSRSIVRIDPVANRVVAFIQIETNGLHFLDGKLWAEQPVPVHGNHEVVVAIDPATNQIVDRVSIPTASGFGFVAGSTTLWYAAGPGRSPLVCSRSARAGFRCSASFDLVRFDPRTRRASVTRRDVRVVLVAADGRLWLLTSSFELIEVDETSGTQVGPSIPIDASENLTGVVASGVLWLAGQLASSSPGSVTPYDVVTHRALHAPIPVGGPIVGMTVIDSVVWVDTGGLIRIPFHQ
jgi:hypothetical protein